MSADSGVEKSIASGTRQRQPAKRKNQFIQKDQSEDEGYSSRSSSLSSNISDGSSVGRERNRVVADSIPSIDECDESLASLSLSIIKVNASLDGVDKVNIHQELGKFKEASLMQRLLSFTIITTLSKSPGTASKLANAGFVALTTSFGVCFGCPDCKLVCSLPLKDFENPKAFHKTECPSCATFRSSVETEFDSAMDVATAHHSEALSDDSSMPNDSGLGVSVTSDRSLFTATSYASSVGVAAATVATSNEPGQRDMYKSLKESENKTTLRSVELMTENYQIRKSPVPMAVERNRRKTFKERHSLDTRITKIYAASGLYLSEEHKGRLELSCAWCEFRMNFSREMATNKQTAKELLEKHVMEYYCDFITGRESRMRNVPDLFNEECWMNLTKPPLLEDEEATDQLAGFQINYNHAKHPGMAVRDRRQDSFLTFPSDSTQHPDALVEAGYFYASGKSDTVTCFMCGIVSSDWSINETPWQRHARSSATCQHVMSQKGEEFVRSTLDEYGEYRERKKENRIRNVTTRMLRPRMDAPVVQQALKCGITRDHIKTVVSNRIMAGDPDFTKLEDLIRAVQDLRVPESHLNNTTRDTQFPEVICQPSLITHDEQDEGYPEDDGFTETVDSGSLPVCSDKSRLEEQRLAEIERRKSDQEAINNFGSDMSISELKNQLTCKVCLTDPVGIIFIPCGHLVCCTACAAAMTICPICRKGVNGTIRANFRADSCWKYTIKPQLQEWIFRGRRFN